MSLTVWTLVPLIPVHPNRSWHNRFRKAKTMTAAPHPDTKMATAALRQSTADLPIVAPVSAPPAPMLVDQDTPIYAQIVTDLKFDPSSPVKVSAQNRRQRRSNQRVSKTVTDRVWASLLPDGTVAADRVVPVHITKTSELPIIKKVD